MKKLSSKCVISAAIVEKVWISPCTVLEPIIETCRTRFDGRRITLETRFAATETVHIKGESVD
jgi:hypothetical protein